MLKRPITYLNIDDEEVTNDYFFNLTEQEVVKFQYSNKGASLQELIHELTLTKDYPRIVEIIETFIRMSYGVRVGDQFVKTEEVWNAFKFTNAYSALFMELMQDSTKAAEFVNGVMPKEKKSKETPATIAAKQ